MPPAATRGEYGQEAARLPTDHPHLLVAVSGGVLRVIPHNVMILWHITRGFLQRRPGPFLCTVVVLRGFLDRDPPLLGVLHRSVELVQQEGGQTNDGGIVVAQQRAESQASLQ